MRDTSLRLSFTTAAAATGRMVSNAGLGTNSVILSGVSGTTISWAQGFSEPFNLNRFSSTLADASVFAAQANPTATGTDAPLSSSTSYGEYNIRVAIGSSPMFATRPVSVTAQTNRSATSTAPNSMDTLWANCGSTFLIEPTASYTGVLVTADTDLWSNTGIVPGTFFRTNQASSGFANTTMYVLGSDNYVLTTDGLKLDITADNLVTGVTGFAYPAEAVGTATVTAYDSTTGVFTSTANVKLDDCVVFTTLGLGTGATFTRYWINNVVTGGFTLASSLGGATLTGWTGSVGTTTATVIRYQTLPEFAVAATLNSDIFESRANTGTGAGTPTIGNGSLVAIPHGLKVGDVLIRVAGNIAPALGSIPAGAYVTEIVSQTQFKMSSTYKGPNITATAASVSLVVEPVRNIRLVGIQMDKTTRQWVRIAATGMQAGSPDVSKGNIVILFAEVTPGRDGSFVLS